MPPTHLDQLLEPTLRADAPVLTPYSVRAGFVVSFLGGPFATVIYGILNARRAGRLPRDLGVLLAGALIWALMVGYSTWLTLGGQLPEWLGNPARPASNLRWFVQLAGMGAFGLLYLRHREMHAAADLRPGMVPSPWVPGLLMVVVAAVSTIAVVMVAASVR